MNVLVLPGKYSMMGLGVLDVVLFALVVILMGVLLLARLQAMFVSPVMPRVNIDALHPCTGDLIFIDANVGVAMFAAAWTHVGMVVMTQGGAGLLEITPATGTPVLTPLAPRLRAALADPNVAVCVRAVRCKVGRRRAAAAVGRTRGLCYEHTYWSAWMNHLVGWMVPVPEDQPSATYCSDLVCRVAWHMGLVQREHNLPSTMVGSTWHGGVWGPAVRVTGGIKELRVSA